MRVLRLAGIAAVIAGCGGGGDGGSGPGAQVANVVVTTSATSTSICGEVTLSAQPRDAQGNNLSRTVSWSSSNQAAVMLSSPGGPANLAVGVGAGSSTITATADGIASNPGVTLGVTGGGQAPTTQQVAATANNQFSPRCARIAAGGSVTWSFAIAHDVDFTGTNNPTGGDIPQRSSGTESRTFPAAGVYPYHCNLHAGMNGWVVVQ